MHLSVAETYMLKNPNKLDLYLQEIKEISNLLDRYNKWKSREKFYWKWMVNLLAFLYFAYLLTLKFLVQYK